MIAKHEAQRFYWSIGTISRVSPEPHQLELRLRISIDETPLGQLGVYGAQQLS